MRQHWNTAAFTGSLTWAIALGTHGFIAGPIVLAFAAGVFAVRIFPCILAEYGK